VNLSELADRIKMRSAIILPTISAVKIFKTIAGKVFPHQL